MHFLHYAYLQVKELLDEALVLRTADIQNRCVLGNKLETKNEIQDNQKKDKDKESSKKNNWAKGAASSGEISEIGFSAVVSDAQKCSEKYNPHIDLQADLPTMHEAFQYLMKTYVDDILKAREIKKKMNTAQTELSILSAFSGALKKVI